MNANNNARSQSADVSDTASTIIRSNNNSGIDITYSNCKFHLTGCQIRSCQHVGSISRRNRSSSSTQTVRSASIDAGTQTDHLSRRNGDLAALRNPRPSVTLKLSDQSVQQSVLNSVVTKNPCSSKKPTVNSGPTDKDQYIRHRSASDSSCSTQSSRSLLS